MLTGECANVGASIGDCVCTGMGRGMLLGDWCWGEGTGTKVGVLLGPTGMSVGRDGGYCGCMWLGRLGVLLVLSFTGNQYVLCYVFYLAIVFMEMVHITFKYEYRWQINQSRVS